MLCFLAALAMGPISPLLPIAALAYFILMWTFWRYTVRLPNTALTDCWWRRSRVAMNCCIIDCTKVIERLYTGAGVVLPCGH